MDEELEQIARKLHRIDQHILIEVPGFNGWRFTQTAKAHPAEEWEQVPVGRQQAYLELARAFVAADCTIAHREQLAWSNYIP